MVAKSPTKLETQEDNAVDVCEKEWSEGFKCTSKKEDTPHQHSTYMQGKYLSYLFWFEQVFPLRIDASVYALFESGTWTS